jgi:hypothetical protein
LVLRLSTIFRCCLLIKFLLFCVYNPFFLEFYGWAVPRMHVVVFLVSCDVSVLFNHCYSIGFLEEMSSGARRQFQSLEEYYPYYLSQHSNRNCRRLHVVGNSIIIGSVAAAVAQRDAKLAVLGVGAGYAAAWLGHILFEDDQTPLEPLLLAARNPFYGFLCDWRMFGDVLRGKFVW